MHHLEPMFSTHPAVLEKYREKIIGCLQATGDCVQTCLICADACLNEEMVTDLRRCIRLNYDCADVCAATSRMLTRQTEPDWNLLRRQLELCAVACRSCGDECRSHAPMHEHCKVCADACQRTEQVCRQLSEAISRQL